MTQPLFGGESKSVIVPQIATILNPARS